MKKLDEKVYEGVPFIQKAFGDKMHFLALIGSFAAGEETKRDGKYFSDVDYYVVLKRDVEKSEGEKIGHDVQRLLNELSINPPKSIWVIDYKEFYDPETKDTLSPYQIVELDSVIEGPDNVLDPIKNRPIGLHSQIGLCGVSFMDMCNGMEKEKINSLVKGVYGQMGVWLIGHEKFRTKYSERLEEFVKEFPEFGYLSTPMKKALKFKKNLDLTGFNREFGNVQIFGNEISPIFSEEALDRVFHMGATIDKFCESIIDGSPERFIRASYASRYHKNKNLEEKYSHKAAELLGLSVNGKTGLDKLNYIWFEWLKKIGVLESDLKKDKS